MLSRSPFPLTPLPLNQLSSPYTLLTCSSTALSFSHTPPCHPAPFASPHISAIQSCSELTALELTPVRSGTAWIMFLWLRYSTSQLSSTPPDMSSKTWSESTSRGNFSRPRLTTAAQRVSRSCMGKGLNVLFSRFVWRLFIRVSWIKQSLVCWRMNSMSSSDWCSDGV